MIETITIAAAALTGLLVRLITAYINDRTNAQAVLQAEKRVEAEPEKTKPAWDLARATLEKYFNRNLTQVSSIFWLSVLVMGIGFGIIVWGLTKAIGEPSHAGAPKDVDGSNVTLAKIASVAGVITEFIGATFLFVYRSAIQQAVNYSKTLERINSVGMAMQILDTMPDQTHERDLKSRTKARLVMMLVSQSFQASSALVLSGTDDDPKAEVEKQGASAATRVLKKIGGRDEAEGSD